jgi:hypothetical protein
MPPQSSQRNPLHVLHDAPAAAAVRVIFLPGLHDSRDDERGALGRLDETGVRYAW